MYVLLTYDVSKNRSKMVLNTCRKYLTHTQKSVFEGYITEKNLTRLQKELQKIIVPQEDSIIVYKFANTQYLEKHSIGRMKET